MADKTVKITFEIDGLQQSVTNIDDAKVALKELETQAEKTEQAAAGAADEFKDLGNEAKNAGEGGEGAITVLDEATGGLASRFSNVITGVKQMGKSLVTSFKAGVKGASSLKIGIAATGIGLLVIALGAIVAFWDDIIGLVSGVTSEQKKLNEEVDKNLATQQEALAAISAQENSLKLQGKTEEEIRDLKIEQTNEVIDATILQLKQMEATKKAQIEASQRNKDITQGIIRFLTLPITILLGTVDALTAALSLIPGLGDVATNLEDGFSGGLAGLIFDPEEVASEGQAAIDETTKQLTALKNTRDGFILAGEKEDADRTQKEKDALAKKVEDEKAAAEKIAADKKTIQDKADADALKAQQTYLANRQLIDGLLQQADLDAIDDTFERARAELAIQQETDIAKITAAGATAAEIKRIKDSFKSKTDKLNQDEADFKEELGKQDVDNALAAGSQVLGSIVSLVGEGSTVGKAAAIAQTTIDTYSSATAAYSSVVGIPVVGPVLAPIAAGVAVAAGLMSIKKIVSTKVPGGGGGSVPSITVPNGGPPVDPNAAIAGAAEDQAQNNQITLGGQQGSTGGVIRAYVVSSEMSTQQEADAKINDLARL
tara:strand:+ start:6167 stop:7972 length:1806 start_codon:yes stop_codon:yes gene_type:complete